MSPLEKPKADPQKLVTINVQVKSPFTVEDAERFTSVEYRIVLQALQKLFNTAQRQIIAARKVKPEEAPADSDQVETTVTEVKG